MANEIVELTARVEQLIGGLELAIDPIAREAEMNEALVIFEPGQRGEYATPEQRQAVVDRVKGEQEKRAGEGMFHVQRALLATTGPQLEELITRQMEPPSPDEAWARLTGKAGMSIAEMTYTDLGHEMRLQRFNQEFASAMPSEVLRRYERALGDPYRQQNASLIAFVESRLASGRWVGASVPADNEIEINAVSALLGKIKATREGRLTPEALRARAAISRGHQLHQSAKSLHKIRQLRPVGV